MKVYFKRSIALSDGKGGYRKATPGLDIHWNWGARSHFLWINLTGWHHSAF